MNGWSLISPALVTVHHPAWHPGSGTLPHTALTEHGSLCWPPPSVGPFSAERGRCLPLSCSWGFLTTGVLGKDKVGSALAGKSSPLFIKHDCVSSPVSSQI